jgi:hypothetical protein
MKILRFAQVTSALGPFAISLAFGGLTVVAGTVVVAVAGCSSSNSGGSFGGSSSGGGSGSGSSGGGDSAASSSSGSGSSSGGSSSSGGVSGGGSGSSSGGSADGGVSDTACDMMSTSDACYTCCANNHVSGANIWNTAFFDCICAAPNGTQGLCQSQCANTDCSSSADAGSPDAGDPCDICETDVTGADGGCTPSINSACTASADCVAFDNCVNNCP